MSGEKIKWISKLSMNAQKHRWRGNVLICSGNTSSNGNQGSGWRQRIAQKVIVPRLKISKIQIHVAVSEVK